MLFHWKHFISFNMFFEYLLLLFIFRQSSIINSYAWNSSMPMHSIWKKKNQWGRNIIQKWFWKHRTIYPIFRFWHENAFSLCTWKKKKQFLLISSNLRKKEKKNFRILLSFYFVISTVNSSNNKIKIFIVKLPPAVLIMPHDMALSSPQIIHSSSFMGFTIFCSDLSFFVSLSLYWLLYQSIELALWCDFPSQAR